MKHKMPNGWKWLIFLTTLLLIGLGKATPASAVEAGDIDDGISNWESQTASVFGHIYINSGDKLSYGFEHPGSTTITNDTSQASEPGGMRLTIPYSNVSMGFTPPNTSSNGYGASFFGSIGYGGTGDNYNGLGYGIVFSPTQAQANNTGSVMNAMSGKRYFTSVDKDGNQVSKIMGNFVRKDDAGVTHNFEMEILLRHSDNDSSALSQELYVKNTEDTSQNYGILLGEMQNGPLSKQTSFKALPNNSGVYYDQVDYQNNPLGYRLLAPINYHDGPTNYTGYYFDPSTQGVGNTDWLRNFTPENFSGTGFENQNYQAGWDLVSNGLKPGDDRDDYPSYTLKWPYITIAPGEVKHYRAENGMVKRLYSDANVTKRFSNETSADGKNRVGDKLKFTVTATNNGYESQWSELNLKDVIPDGLQIDPNTMKVTTADGATQSIPASAYNAANKELDFLSSVNLTDFQTATFTFETTVLMSASNRTLTNWATVSGHDALAPSGTPDVSATDQVDIPVEKSDYLSTFTKQVKNKTAGETDYQNATTGVYGDTVSYQIKYGVNADSKYGVTSGQLQDKLPAGLTLVPDSIKLAANGSDSSPTDLSQVDLPKLAVGQNATLTFDAKVTGTSPVTLTNNATANIKTDNNLSLTDLSNDAVLNPGSWVGFLSVPDQIDFGTHETKETNFTNQSTTRNGSSDKTLQVENYSTAPNYQVNVFYDNNGDHQLTDANGDTITPSDNQNLIFFKDIATGNWVAVTSTGTPLNSAGFSQTGLNDLTSSVGAGKWRMSNRTYQPKVGTYNGTMTWQVTDSVS